jgi:hypothetical protein
MLALLLIFLLGVHASKMCTYANECAAESGTPYCISGTCHACASNIDCAPGKFCRDGSCLAANSGHPCNSLKFEYDGSPIYPIRGQDEQMFCGSPVYITNSQIVLEWLGVCIHGKCAQCVENFDVSLLDQNTQEFYRQHWAQTLMFPGTICENSKITVEKSDLRSQLDTLLDLPLTIVGLVLIFLLLISLLLALFILCYCYYSRRKYSSKHKLL